MRDGSPKGGPPDKRSIHTYSGDRHLLCIAPTRSGKGTSSIIPNLLTYEGSCLVVDPKGENAWITAEHRREKLGQRVHIIDPWNVVNHRYADHPKNPKKGVREPVSGFNPLASLDAASSDFTDDVAALAEALIVGSPDAREPHWDDSARELCAALIACAVEHRARRDGLAQIREWLSYSDEMLDAFIEANIIARVPANADPANRPLSYAKGARFVCVGDSISNELSSIRSVARTQTAFLDSPVLKESLQDDSLDFATLEATPTTIYLVLPVDKLDTYGRWLRLIVSQAITTIARFKEPPNPPVLFILDEFGTIGALPIIERAFGLFAGMGIKWETFLSNCGVIQFFAPNDVMTSEYLSKLLGVRTEPIQVTKGVADLARMGTGLGAEDQLVQVPLRQPDQLRRLPADQLVAVKAHEQPYLCGHLKYHLPDSPFEKLYRRDPNKLPQT